MDYTVLRVHGGWLIISYVQIDQKSWSEGGAAAAIHSTFISDPNHLVFPTRDHDGEEE